MNFPITLLIFQGRASTIKNKVKIMFKIKFIYALVWMKLDYFPLINTKINDSRLSKEPKKLYIILYQ